MSETFTDIGLRLPNGKEVWGEYKGLTMGTASERLKLAEALAQTENDLNMPQGSFLHQHVWVKRECKPLGEFSIDDLGIITDKADDEGEVLDGQ